jgi:hypothetical protein
MRDKILLIMAIIVLLGFVVGLSALLIKMLCMIDVQMAYCIF